MTTEDQPGRDDWRPWDDTSSGRPAGPAEAPAPAGEPAPGPSGDTASTGDAAPGPSAQRTQELPAWAQAPGGTYEATPPAEAHEATPPGGPAPVGSSAPAATGAAGSPDPFPWYQPVEQPSTPPRERRRPGWGALVGTALAAALLAGTGGGILGAYLVDGGSLQSTGAPRQAAPQPGAGATERPAGSIANIAATATPSVVTLRVDGADGVATGSGWVYDGQGHIVTNNHVVSGASGNDPVTVVLANGQQVDGTIVGSDASYDLAVVKVDRTDLAPLRLGRSSDVVVGDEVVAVGAPLGLDSTVTSGIISALDRPVTPGGDTGDLSYINAIQTDAAINPGNSGGPLLDMNGDVIGVNSAIAQVAGGGLGGQTGNIGVGFAIPSDQVAITVDQLIATGKAQHPVIGVYLDASYDGEGVRIADSGPDGAPAVNPDGPAAAAGLEAGDVIVAFEGTPVSEQGELVVKIRAQRVGDEVTLTIRRGGSDRDVTMVLQGSGDQ
jgi:putative serine protease PepD